MYPWIVFRLRPMSGTYVPVARCQTRAAARRIAARITRRTKIVRV